MSQTQEEPPASVAGPPSAGDGGDDPEVAEVCVRALDVDNREYQWTGRIPWSVPLSVGLRKTWSEVFGIPENVIGFEDSTQTPLDLQKTPRELGLQSGVQVEAVPLDSAWCEGEAECEAKEAEPASLPPPQVDGGASAAAESPAPQAASAGQDGADGAPAALRRAAADGDAAAACADSTSPAASAATAPSSTGRAAPKKPAARSAKAKAKAGSASTPASGSKRKADAKVAAPAAPGEGPLPEGDQKVIFEQTNPKREGSSSFARYEKYKKAKTANEAMRLGACKGDLAHDFKKGYFRRA